MKPWLREIQYSFYLAVHPFKGFWGIKHEGAGSVRAATVLLVLYTLVSVLSAYFTGYLFSPNAAGEVQPGRRSLFWRCFSDIALPTGRLPACLTGRGPLRTSIGRRGMRCCR